MLPARRVSCWRILGTTVHKFQSGPLGGDQQIGAKIAEGIIDFMIFFWHPLDSSLTTRM